MKIALYGPSGTGKTTLAKKIAEAYNLKFIPGSSFSKLLDNSQRDFLKETFGYSGSGHREVIRLSLQNPSFARHFQGMVLQNRARFLKSETNFVTDRSPVDNLTYFLFQNASQCSEEEVLDFIEKCKEVYPLLTHAIRLTTHGMAFIEDNNSRVNNLPFQKVVDAIFTHTFDTYFKGLDSVNHFTCKPRSFDTRVLNTFNFINETIKG